MIEISVDLGPNSYPIAIGHGLVSAVHRRRRDLALLKTLGFRRAQISATIAWQATTVAAAAIRRRRPGAT